MGEGTKSERLALMLERLRELHELAEESGESQLAYKIDLALQEAREELERARADDVDPAIAQH